MSHWQKGKISLKCSLNILQRALLNIMPQWKEHLEVSKDGNLVLNSSYESPKSGYSLAVRIGDETGVRGADIGFKKEKDGSWSFSYDYLPDGLPTDVDGAVILEMSKMRARMLAKYQNLEIVKDEAEGDEHVIQYLVPVSRRNKKNTIRA